MFFDAFEVSSDRIKKVNTPEKIVLFIIVSLLMLVLAVNLYNATDKTPATFDDYSPLNERLLAVEDNYENLLNGDGQIVIKDGFVQYTIENDECSMTGIYDSDYKIVVKTQKDKSWTPLTAFFMAVLVSLVFASLSYMLGCVAIFIGIFIANIIIALVKKYKEKSKGKINENSQSIEEEKELEIDDEISDEEALSDSADEISDEEVQSESTDESSTEDSEGDSKQEELIE